MQGLPGSPSSSPRAPHRRAPRPQECVEPRSWHRGRWCLTWTLPTSVLMAAALHRRLGAVGAPGPPPGLSFSPLRIHSTLKIWPGDLIPYDQTLRKERRTDAFTPSFFLQTLSHTPTLGAGFTRAMGQSGAQCPPWGQGCACERAGRSKQDTWGQSGRQAGPEAALCVRGRSSRLPEPVSTTGACCGLACWTDVAVWSLSISGLPEDKAARVLRS